MELVLVAAQALVVLGAIVMGVRMGGIGLGLWGVLGTAVLVFAFGLAPGDPPIDAFFIIIAVIMASAAMQAAGGIDWLVGLASTLIRRNPRQVTIVAPVVAFLFTMGAGTGNIFFALIPVIYESAYRQGIRPERPLAAATVASALGITASPVSAAMAAYLTLLPDGYGLGRILVITVPAALVACVVIGLVQNRIGTELLEDPEYLRRLEEGEVEPSPALAHAGHPVGDTAAAQAPAVHVPSAAVPVPPERLPAGARLSAGLFLAGVGLVVVFGAFKQLRPEFTVDGETTRLGMTTTIQLVMFTVALLIAVTTRVRAEQIVRAPLLLSGLTAAVALFGIAWVADTFISNNKETVIGPLGDAVRAQPLFLAVALFLVCGLTTSQSAATRTVIPIAIAAGLPVAVTTALWPSLVGVWLFPANGPQIAAVEIDRTGSTRLTSNPLWHSFTIPMLVGWVSVVAVGLLISTVIPT